MNRRSLFGAAAGAALAPFAATVAPQITPFVKGSGGMAHLVGEMAFPETNAGSYQWVVFEKLPLDKFLGHIPAMEYTIEDVPDGEAETDVVLGLA